MSPDGTFLGTEDLPQKRESNRHQSSVTGRLQTRRLLVIGATGVFGRRFVRHMSADPRFEILLASRHQDRSQMLACELEETAAAKLSPVCS